MPFHGKALGKSFLTVFALVWLLFGVGAIMSCQVRGGKESFAANWTKMCHFSGMFAIPVKTELQVL